jgi:LmbE family N-acetylglucosaminyl deacetylase
LKKYNLLVVAHPDDETIFFGGVVQVYRRRPWKIVCVTDGNADGGHEARKRDFLLACNQLKAKEAEMWDFPDRYGKRLDVNAVVERLKSENAAEVFTHGALGEYGHPHHQDVCLAVYRAFANRVPKTIVWSSAYNCFSEKVHRVPNKLWEIKAKVLSQIYFSETHRFARWLPAYSHEGFCQLTLGEVEAVHAFLSSDNPLDATKLKAYAWFQPYFEEFRSQTRERPF